MSPDTPGSDWLEPLASLATTTHSFIVTIRSHPLQPNGQTAEWHGSVEHMQSRERIFFIDYARLNNFLAARSATRVRPPWRTRLARRWQKTGLHQLLRRLRFARSPSRLRNRQILPADARVNAEFTLAANTRAAPGAHPVRAAGREPRYAAWLDQ